MSLYGPTEYAKSQKRDKLLIAKFDAVTKDEIIEALLNYENDEAIETPARKRHVTTVGEVIEIALRKWWAPEIERDVRIWAAEQEEVDRANYEMSRAIDAFSSMCTEAIEKRAV